MKEGMHNQYGDLPTTAGLIYLIYPLLVIWLVFRSDRIGSADMLTILAILIAVLAIVAGLDAWKSYLRHLRSASDRIEARHNKLEEEEKKRKEAIIAQDEQRKKDTKEHEDNIKEIFTKLFDAKIEELKGEVTKKITRDELLNLAKELKTITEEHYDAERKLTKSITHFVPDDVRNKILENYPVSSNFELEPKPKTHGN